MASFPDEYTVTVKVRIKWSHLLKLLFYRTLKGKTKITIEQLIERDKRCNLGE